MPTEKMRTSRSALVVCLARAHLTWMGVLDDPHARGLLPRSAGWQAAVSLLRAPGLGMVGRSSSLAYLAGRMHFYDNFVRNALDQGVRQVVVLGAGYDSRAWRLARPGAAFYEVDPPGIQADKRSRAPEGGPIYVPAAVTDPALGRKLIAAGLDVRQATAFVFEGVRVYLTEDQLTRLLRTLRGLGGAGSVLAMNIGVGVQRGDTRRGRLGRCVMARGDERSNIRLPLSTVTALLSTAGWRIRQTANGSQLQDSYLTGTRLAHVKITTAGFAVRADLAVER